MEYRKTKDEFNYFGSDYNKWLNKKCTKKMTVNNIDVIQWKADQRLRIIESKHTNERVKPTQLQVLTLLGKVFKQANKISRKYIFEVFIITGDYPFKTVKIEDLITGEKVICNNIDLFKKFSNLEIGFKELVEN